MTVNGAPLAPNPLTASVASPVVVQVPQVSAVHAVTLNAPPLSGSAATAVAAAVAQQELRQQQNTQQVHHLPGSNGLDCKVPTELWYYTSGMYHTDQLYL